MNFFNESKLPTKNQIRCQTRQKDLTVSQKQFFSFEDIHPFPPLSNEKEKTVKIQNCQNESKDKEDNFRKHFNLRSSKKQKYNRYFDDKSAEKRRDKGRVSDYKNLGKALVKLLRRIIREEYFPKDEETAETNKDLWAIFKRAVPNITMASAVLGSIENFSYTTLTKLGFKRLLQKRTHPQIEKAQVNIRHGILKQLQYINIEQQIDKSKVSQKDKFKKYMNARINEMRNGTFKQRISQDEFCEKEEKQKRNVSPIIQKIEENQVVVKQQEKEPPNQKHIFLKNFEEELIKKEAEIDDLYNFEEIEFLKNAEERSSIKKEHQNNFSYLQYSLQVLGDNLAIPWLIQ